MFSLYTLRDLMIGREKSHFNFKNNDKVSIKGQGNKLAMNKFKVEFRERFLSIRGMRL